jgi:hypothetical protein
MLLNREPYKSILKVFTFLGFWDEISMRQRRWTFFTPLSLLFFEEIFIFLSVLQAHTLQEMLDAAKIIPLLPVINFSLYSFYIKKSKLKKLIEIIDSIERDDPRAAFHIDKGCAIFKKVIQCMACFMAVLMTVIILGSVTYKHLIFPMYMPEFIEHVHLKSLIFYCFWFIESIVSVHSALSYVLFHEFRCSLLIILSHVMEFYREKMRSLKPNKDNPDEMKKELQYCADLNQRIKR